MFSRLKNTHLSKALFIGAFFFNVTLISPASAADVVHTARSLINDDFYFSAIPFLQEAIKSGRSSGEVNELLERVVSKVGVGPFELMKLDVLASFNSPVTRYIRARKLANKEQYKEALELASSIPSSHSLKPQALMLEASILTLTGHLKEAVPVYERCMDETSEGQIARDTCLVGLARTYFAMKKYKEAESKFLDLSKNSLLWPDILFEEAWNSFYKKDYNRTLGKLVSYNAPIFDFYFNPETDVLKALTYLNMCLWNDVKKTVDDFYARYEQQVDEVGQFLDSHGKDYVFYARLGLDHSRTRVQGNELLNWMLKSIVHDPEFKKDAQLLADAQKELARVKAYPEGQQKSVMLKGVSMSADFQQKYLGLQVKNNLYRAYGDMTKAFEGMSYIKLEVLSRKKDKIYADQSVDTRTRGSIQYLKRNEKQYFWNFNGEFWADELGDYVFALKSECE